MTFRAFLAVVSAAVVALASPSAQDRSAADYARAIEGAQGTAGPNELGSLTIDQLMTRFNVPGVSVAVIRDFQIHWAKGCGVADVETGAPVDTETMFHQRTRFQP